MFTNEEFDSHYAPASEGLRGYDNWKSDEGDDSDVVYFDTWEEAERRAAQMKRNAESFKAKSLVEVE